ncbi:MAG: hypothetical protein Q8N88_02515 [Nanoarchaeota archaeon]|nr:hypothetical protein [Nanoarchaeota archaeon]
MTGIRDALYERFAIDLMDGKINFKQRLKKWDFPEVRQMNLQRAEYKKLEGTENTLLIASRINEPELFKVYPFGKIERVGRWAVLGPDEVRLHIDTHDFRMFELTASETAERVLRTLEVANQNEIIRGYDLAVVRRSGILYFGDYIQREMEKARN